MHGLGPLHRAQAQPILEGQTAPGFTTQAALAGKPFVFNLAGALKKGPVVLYFFPASFTPGCTLEAHEFSKAAAQFRALGATVIGLAADPIATLKRFSVEACRNAFPVGVATPAIIQGYGVKLPNSDKANRTTFVIAPSGKVSYVYTAAAPAAHIANSLAAVKALR